MFGIKRDRKGNGIIFKKWEIYNEEIKIRERGLNPQRLTAFIYKQ